MIKILLVFVFAVAVSAQNFTENETAISVSLYKKIAEKESKYFSINQIGNVNRYFICNCENFDISYEDGLAVIKNYENYETQFKYIVKSQSTGGSGWFFVLGIALVKTWLWGNVFEKSTEESAEISFVQTKSEINYSDSVKSLAVIDFDKLVLQWNLIKINETNSRFCLTGIAQPQKPVPQWLVKTALKKVVPKTLRNIKKAERGVQRQPYY
jgi:hypothetical protein